MKQRAYRRMRAHAFDWQIAQRAAMWRKASRVQRALFGHSRRRWRVGLPRYKAPDLIWFDESHAFDTPGVMLQRYGRGAGHTTTDKRD